MNEQLQLLLDLPKRQIILSLQPEPYQLIKEGKKTIEFRRRFIKEPAAAFVYVSSPVKQIKAFIEFGMPIQEDIDTLVSIAEGHGQGSGAELREYFSGVSYGYAIPILSCIEFAPMSLELLKGGYEFNPPQSYMNLSVNPRLEQALLNKMMT
ncbi:hypothetical protein ACFQ3J_09400 [Paenibacillus provencensis]|uniref:Transcriptional regulator n=1 Tax=Paenibacillus provencensis TaxID=441151 RepID=A0ABW3PW72_9BACL|nr:hypothetical protein [Paenibacillus sp. MER 78]MCM3128895.1 hypothetical protein [Paenibacillus sp. MER 78]